MNNKKGKLISLLPGLQENILLKNYTTFKIGGPAKYFYIAKTKKDLIKAVKKAKEYSLPFFILGGGSKLLVSDQGFDGMIIKMQSAKCKAQNNSEKFKTIHTEAGVKLSDLVKFCLKENLAGLEWAAGIPRATIGGAIRGNAGAFGNSFADIVDKVEVLNLKDFQIETLNNQECKFDYRTSIFKKNRNLIIVSAELKLKQANKREVKQKIKEIFDYRKNHHPMEFPSVGSIFINPENQSAGSLIEQCGLKGKQIGSAQISEKHANFIVNLGNAKASDVIKLIGLAKTKVKQKFGIELEEEIQYLGFQQP